MPNYGQYGYQYPQYGYQMPQQQPQQVQVQPQAQPQTQIQNSGFLSVPSEDIVRTYPVAPGNCVTFKIEGKPIVMEKSMGFSQLESPKVERYRLVKEDVLEASNQPQIERLDTDPIFTTISDLKSKIEVLESELDGIKKKLAPKTAPKKKEVPEDDE